MSPMSPGVSQPSQGTATLVPGLRGSHLRKFRNFCALDKGKTRVILIQTSTCDTWLEQIFISACGVYIYIDECVSFLNIVLSADWPLHCIYTKPEKNRMLECHISLCFSWIRKLLVGSWGWVGLGVCARFYVHERVAS